MAQEAASAASVQGLGETVGKSVLAVHTAAEASAATLPAGRAEAEVGKVLPLRASDLRVAGSERVRPPARKLRRVLVAVDAAAASGSWALMLAVGGGGEHSTFVRGILVVSITLLTLALLQVHQLYLARICRVRAVEVSRLARVTVLVGAVGYFVSGRVPIGLTGATAARGALLSFAALAVTRSAYTSWLKRLRSQGEASRPVVIVGDNEEGVDLRRHLEHHRELGFSVVALAACADEVPLALQKHGADSVIIAVSALGKTELNDLTRRLLDAGVHVHLSCGLAGVDHRRLRQVPLAREPLFYVERLAVSQAQVVLSRMIDIVGSIVGLFLTAPVMAATAILIRAHDGGPVLFQQERIGRDGRPFKLYKLRTMVPDAESRLASVEATNHRDGPLFKAQNDARVTPIGRLLRAASIDELPQLMNVLLGSMSLVGPRPALAHEVAQFDEELLNRLKVKPGITGLWQVEARHDPSFDSYRRLDLFYIENWSLELDLVILLTTAKGLLGQALRDMRKQWRPLPPQEMMRRIEIEALPNPVPAL